MTILPRDGSPNRQNKKWSLSRVGLSNCPLSNLFNLHKFVSVRETKIVSDKIIRQTAAVKRDIFFIYIYHCCSFFFRLLLLLLWYEAIIGHVTSARCICLSVCFCICAQMVSVQFSTKYKRKIVVQLRNLRAECTIEGNN